MGSSAEGGERPDGGRMRPAAGGRAGQAPPSTDRQPPSAEELARALDFERGRGCVMMAMIERLERRVGRLEKALREARDADAEREARDALPELWPAPTGAS